MPRPAAADDVTMTVYKYGIRGDLPPEAVAELRRAHDLRNRLTEIELAYQDTVAAAWEAHPEIGEALDRRDTAEQAAAAAASDVKAGKAASRGTKPDPALAAVLKEARAVLGAAKAEVKELKDRYYASDVKPAMLEAGEVRKRAVKAAYAEAVAGGLYWATVNDVTDHHNTSVRQVTAHRKAGQAAQVRYSRWAGEGTLAVQLQRQASDPPRLPALIGSGGGKWRNVAVLSPWEPPEVFDAMPRCQRRKTGRAGVLSFRIGSGDAKAMVTVPVVVHRMLPPEADITGMRITRRMVAGKPRVTVAVTARVPAPQGRAEGPLAAVHSGWRVLDGKAIRVAVVSGTGPVPASLAGVVRDHGGWCEVVVPASWRDVQARTEAIRSRRDQSLDGLKARLAGWLDRNPGGREALDPDGTMARWRSPARFAALAIRLRTDTPEGCEEPAGWLETWRKQDKHLWTFEANERDQLTARRDDAWRKAAEWITRDCAVVALDEWQIAPLARRPGVAGEDDPQSAAARANRVLAAPASLRAAVENAARRRGVTVTRPQAGPAVHGPCGTVLDAAGRMDAAMVWCPACEVMLDQDRNSLLLLEAAARGEVVT